MINGSRPGTKTCPDEPVQDGRGLLRRLASLARDRRGVGAVEFALLAPLLLMLYIGAFEITVGLSVAKRATRAAGAIADLVTQQDKPVDKTFLATMSDVADAIFVPYSTSGLTLKITGVTLDSTAKATVKWSWQKGGTAAYQLNSQVLVPADLKQANTFLIRTELSVPHKLMLFMADNLSMKTMSINISREYFFRPRTGSSIECSNCPT